MSPFSPQHLYNNNIKTVDEISHINNSLNILLGQKLY